ncbi:uncharacterized protein LOC122075501 [Macadamia integrifolia]|uniref:uncharacterized protein LOC122075501 n=1 Tax=Macadamia integrifolia TaxID=60698 RepID=UPI001C4FC8ED|nr:uncharacterized protein LOC122075501 [Macadamia integrifolia]
MSWLSIPLPNPFKFQPPDDEEEDSPGGGGGGGGGEEEEEEEEEEDEESSSPGGGVKEDLSELRKTIGRQLWGVASFLAPPPVTSSPQSSVDSTSTHDSSSQTLLGIRNDFAEIGGSFKSGLSILSTNMAVNEISKLASNFLLFPKDGDDVDEFSVEGHGGDIVGVTEEVLEFVREMSMRPECWTDFPLSLENDFEMSDAQREHASTVENLAPSLAGLNVRLCPSHMNEGQFWMIYFILLHPRLNEHDSKLLSTPQIIEARDSLLQKLQKRVNEQVESSKNGDSLIEVSDKGTKIQEESNPAQEKEVLVETVNSPHHIKAGEQEKTEGWLEEEDETDTSVAAHKQLGNEEDVSFSDLEEDDNDDNTSSRQRFLNSEKDIRVSSSSNGSSNEWVRLNENSDSQEKKVVETTSREKDSEGEESNDWLTIDDFD